MQSTGIKIDNNEPDLARYLEQDVESMTEALATNPGPDLAPGNNARTGLLDQLDRANIRLHVTILGWLYVISNAVLLLIGAFVFTFLSGIGAVVDDPQAFAVLSIVGTTVGILLGALALPGIAAGVGLLRGKEWGRILGVVVAIIGLINVPLGTLIGFYALWVLLQRESARYFEKAALGE